MSKKKEVLDLNKINMFVTMLESGICTTTIEYANECIKKLKDYGGFICSSLILRLENFKKTLEEKKDE